MLTTYTQMHSLSRRLQRSHHRCWLEVFVGVAFLFQWSHAFPLLKMNKKIDKTTNSNKHVSVTITAVYFHFEENKNISILTIFLVGIFAILTIMQQQKYLKKKGKKVYSPFK